MQNFPVYRLSLLIAAILSAAGLILTGLPSDTQAADLIPDNATTNHGSISGHVYQADGTTPIAGANVAAMGRNKGAGQATTDVNGAYIIESLANDSYFVEAYYPGYLPEYYDGVSSPKDVTWIAVTGAGVISGIDFDLTLGGSISGRVCEADGVTPVAEAQVQAWATNGLEGSATTNADGYYTILSLESDSYIIQAWAPGFFREYYAGADSPVDATAVSLTRPENISGINFTLDLGGSISGRVCHSDGITPISNAGIEVEGKNGAYSWAEADTQGYYNVVGLATDSYQVSASASGFHSKFFDNQTSSEAAAWVDITAPEAATGINFSLDFNGSITGYVYQADGVTPINRARVTASGQSEGQTRTDANGEYVLPALTPGNYRIQAKATGYLTKYYNNVFSQNESTLVNVSGTETKSNINFNLTRGGSISGRVCQKDGTPIADAEIQAIGRHNGSGETFSNSNGEFIISGLPPDEYRIYVYAFGYLPEYFNNVSSDIDAALITISGEENISDVNFSLDRGGTISGRVYMPHGASFITDTMVNCRNIIDGQQNEVDTDLAGNYTISGLTTGDYRVYASATGYYCIDARTVNVIIHENTTNIDLTLDPDVLIRSLTSNFVPPDGDFVVIVYTKNSWNVNSFQFDLSYDPAVLRIDNVISGTENWPTFSVDQWNLSPGATQGRVIVSGHALPANQLRRNGCLAEIHFHCIGSPGQSSPIAYSNGVLTDFEAQPFNSVTWESGAIAVSKSGDINGDGQISMGDVTGLERIILGLDKSITGVDVNQDGATNMGDVTKLERLILGLE